MRGRMRADGVLEMVDDPLEEASRIVARLLAKRVADGTTELDAVGIARLINDAIMQAMPMQSVFPTGYHARSAILEILPWSLQHRGWIREGEVQRFRPVGKGSGR